MYNKHAIRLLCAITLLVSAGTVSASDSPTCMLTASPSSISAGATSMLMASCDPAATSYVWSANAGFASTVTTGSVSPTATTSYTVAGINSAGTGTAVGGTVTVVTQAATPVCVLTAIPSSISAGAQTMLMAGCNPAATAYAWTGGTCVEMSGMSDPMCMVTPSASTTYTVAGISSGGTGAAASATVTVAANPVNDIIVTLEEPVHGGTASGVGNVRGWAVSPRPIQRIDLYIDGNLAFTVPYGGSRSDVNEQHPGSMNSGFSMAYNFGLLSAGHHTFVTRAVDDAGNVQEKAATFNVVRFPSSFISSPADVSLQGASPTMVDAITFGLNNVLVQGVYYNLALRWNTATQGFAPTTISSILSTPQYMYESPVPMLAETAAPAGDMIVTLEEPVHGGTASGVGNVRGWAVSSQPIQRMELYIDGSLAFTVPYGGSRSDVGAAYATYPGSANSGFSMAYNFGLLSAGNHTFMTRAVDKAGNIKEAAATFNVVRFPSSFISNPADVSLMGIGATIVDANTVGLNNVMVQGVSYGFTLRWNTATQGFALVSQPTALTEPTCGYCSY